MYYIFLKSNLLLCPAKQTDFSRSLLHTAFFTHITLTSPLILLDLMNDNISTTQTIHVFSSLHSVCSSRIGLLINNSVAIDVAPHTLYINPLFTHDTLGQQMLPHPFKYLLVATCVYATLIFYHC